MGIVKAETKTVETIHEIIFPIFVIDFYISLGGWKIPELSFAHIKYLLAIVQASETIT